MAGSTNFSSFYNFNFLVHFARLERLLDQNQMILVDVNQRLKLCLAVMCSVVLERGRNLDQMYC